MWVCVAAAGAECCHRPGPWRQPVPTCGLTPERAGPADAPVMVTVTVTVTIRTTQGGGRPGLDTRVLGCSRWGMRVTHGCRALLSSKGRNAVKP